MVKGILVSLLVIFTIIFTSLVITNSGRIEVLHIPPDEHFFVPLDELGVQQSYWYKFSVDDIDLTSIRKELVASPLKVSILSGRYDLRSSLKDKETGEVFYIGYADNNTEPCHSFIKKAENLLCQPEKADELFQQINDALKHQYLARFWGWLLHL